MTNDERNPKPECRKQRGGLAPQSADFQSAVSQGFQPAAFPTFPNRTAVREPADWKSLRYALGGEGWAKAHIEF